jgi:chromosome segregation ATPase
VYGNSVKQFGPLSDIAMQADSAGGKIIAADWRGLVRVWTPDGKKAGDLSSNPPTIAERIDLANQRIAILQPRAAKTQDAAKHAADAVAAAQKRAAGGAAALAAKKAAFADAQNRIGPLERQSADAAAAIQRAQADLTRLTAACGETACAAAAIPLLHPEAISTLAARAISAQSLAAQKAALAQTQTALAAARDRCAGLSREIDAQTRANNDAASGIKSAQAALAATQAAEVKAAAQIKAANLALIKWRTAAARLTSDPQYAAWKADPK